VQVSLGENGRRHLLAKVNARDLALLVIVGYESGLVSAVAKAPG
jgi:hypothetical protein